MLSPVLGAVLENLTTHQAQLANKPLYVACSGGRDSLVLAHLCMNLSKQGMLPRPILIHVNHNIQSCAKSWAQGVSEFAQAYDLPCHIINVQLTDSSEKGAREARYLAFAMTMADDGVIALAHHQDDQAETVLMRLMNGTGIQGLGGMQPWRTHKQDQKSIHLFRPLLSVSRADISEYAKIHALAYVDDPSNETGDNVRAMLRQQVMPSLRQINPKAAANIARTAVLVGQSQRLLKKHVAHKLAQCLIANRNWHCRINDVPCADWQTCLDIDRLMALGDDMAAAVLHAFVQGDEPNSAPYALICRIKELCQKSSTDHQTTLFWQGRFAWVFVRYDRVLYRYAQPIWQQLQQQMTAKIDVDDSVVMDKPCIGLSSHNRTTCFVMPLDVNMSADVVIIPLSKTDKLTINIGTDACPNYKTLSQKKLYQTLRIPVWYRQHLFCLYGRHNAYLIAMCGIWNIKTQADKNPSR